MRIPKFHGESMEEIQRIARRDAADLFVEAAEYPEEDWDGLLVYHETLAATILAILSCNFGKKDDISTRDADAGYRHVIGCVFNEQHNLLSFRKQNKTQGGDNESSGSTGH